MTRLPGIRLRMIPAAAAIAAAVLLSGPLDAAVRFFIVKFDGTRIAAHLEDADAAFVVGGGRIRRSGSGQQVEYASAERH